MADAMIFDLTEKTVPVITDEMELQETAGGDSKKATLGNLLKIINGLTAKSTPVAADLFVIYDVSGTAPKKVTLTELLAVIFGADITLADGVDIATNATTGTKIGTATTQKLAFWNAAPIVQPASANQAALTNSTGGTGDGTLAAIAGTGADADINNNFTELYVLLNEMRTVLVNTGLMKGSA